MKVGLDGTTSPKNYEDSADGVIYLCKTASAAEAYAEISDLAPEEYLGQIVILGVNCEGLDLSLLRADQNIIVEDAEEYNSLEYHEPIPPELIQVLESAAQADAANSLTELNAFLKRSMLFSYSSNEHLDSNE